MDRHSHGLKSFVIYSSDGWKQNASFFASGQQARNRILAQETTIMMTQEAGFLKAYEVFEKICRFVKSASRDGFRLRRSIGCQMRSVTSTDQRIITRPPSSH